MVKDVIKSIYENKIIVIVRGVSFEVLLPLAKALYGGGIRLLEITFSADGRVSDNETAEQIKMLLMKCFGYGRKNLIESLISRAASGISGQTGTEQ